ncbi:MULTISPECIES: DUF2061 domain-containing protein [Aestuariibaculum]|uniref:DUF2061 domain-containing protein n=1 Tax=Aestuariibaculum lutulentum TaxID=2920935 RepID=A0ABS9RL04_9FLAO|nr:MULTISPECIES: DUF2061 domain-containing protein [Aestuariibaculum]MCH4553196.1 DUF2061 domain-containing protein [Aestuariibaculum lutulentum]MCR8668835.1 DUF2061 domain-containing protein [Aestuariibaculum sp. M13]
MIEQVLTNSSQKEKTTYKTDAASEKPIRSVVKSLSWRTIGTLDTILISWIVTGELTLAFSIGSIELVTKMVLYFFHERIWNSIKWGK